MCKFTLPEMHDPEHQHKSLLRAGVVLLCAVDRDHQPAILFTGAVLVCVVDKRLFARQRTDLPYIRAITPTRGYVEFWCRVQFIKNTPTGILLNGTFLLSCCLLVKGNCLDSVQIYTAGVTLLEHTNTRFC